jgi:hypothetical protein
MMNYETMIKESRSNQQLRSWLTEGRCPECGDLGPLDPCGGAMCRKHGLYFMVAVLPPMGKATDKKPSSKEPEKNTVITMKEQVTVWDPDNEVDRVIKKGETLTFKRIRSNGQFRFRTNDEHRVDVDADAAKSWF